MLKHIRKSFPDIRAPMVDAAFDYARLLVTHLDRHLELLVLDVQIRSANLLCWQFNVLLSNVDAHLAQRHSNVPRLQCPGCILVHYDSHDAILQHVGGLEDFRYSINRWRFSEFIYKLTRFALKVSETRRSLVSSALISLYVPNPGRSTLL